MDWKTEIKTEAQRLGFLLVGVAPVQTPPHYSAYEHWLERGRHGQMGYLANERARQRRFDPHQILPVAKSILCLALPYEAPLPGEDPKPVEELGTGEIAAYAWGPDYHEIIPERMNRLVGWVEQRLGRPIHWKGYTDTGPILERDIASLAGLGWIGKNTCLIHPKHGSFFFLAEILWDVALEPDSALNQDYCGSCRRCIEACPTDCILPDRTIDATRCISYQTIENKTEIPADLRPAMGSWVFGCDVCQQVCPWNIRFAERHGDPVFRPASSQPPRPDLASELALTPEAFNQKLRHSPIQRSRRRGYLRNLSVALGNQKRPESLPALTKALFEETEPQVRAHAAWAIGQLGGAAARQALLQAKGEEQVENVVEEIRSALQSLR
jgi:epoxyqueuosine reductase